MAKLIQASSSAPVNEGERRVIEALVNGLPDDYWIIPNVEIIEPQGQCWEYDVIVIAPHAVYVLETKDWHGEIVGDEREWLVNGASRKSPTSATELKAKVLKSKLVNYAHALIPVRVEGRVVLASTPSILRLAPAVEDRVIPLAKLVSVLTDPGRIRQKPYAIVDLQSLIVRALDVSTHARSGPRSFGHYEVLELLEQAEGEALYRAKHRLMPNAAPVRLRVVTLPYLLTEQQRDERHAALAREAEALHRMGSHPNIVAAREVFLDEEGRIVLVLDGMEGRSLRQRLLDGTPMTVAERLNLLADVCRALTHAHAHGVTHRRLEPASIMLGDDGAARLARFDLAKIEASGAATVWNEDAALELDLRYVAPELVNVQLGAPGPATDLYQLGCVAYELFTGHPPFSNPMEALGDPPVFPEAIPDRLRELLRTLLAGNPHQRPVDAKDVLAAIEGMGQAHGARPATGPKDRYDTGDVIDGKFQVLERLGGGGFSTVYRVYWALADQEYALKVFNTQVQYDKIQREFSLLLKIDHPLVVKAVTAEQTRAGQWYLVTELVSGETLEQYAAGKKRLSVEEAVDVACQLLRALEAIHPDAQRIGELAAKKDAGEIEYEEYQELQRLQASGIVHRDIKPQNVMLTPKGIMLIDFNIASRVGQQVLTISGTPRYLSPDLLAGTDTWDVSPDLFAVGVMLYELICWEHPYDDGQPRPQASPIDPRRFRPDLSPAVATFLMKATQPHRGDRFASALAMRSALEAITPLRTATESEGGRSDGRLSPRLRELLTDPPPNVNPMVLEFLALSSQARKSNRGTRGMDDLAEATYVETRLDRELSRSVLNGQHKLVIVTGNAGDGKTAFIQQVETAARHHGAVDLARTTSGARLRAGDVEIVTLYDGSQDDEDRSSDDMLLDFFAPYADLPAPEGVVSLAAINEGRLRDFLTSHLVLLDVLARDIIAMLDDPSRSASQEGVIVVNLNARSVTAGGTQSIFSRQIQMIVAGPFWAPCEACDYRTRCPIKHNVDTFRDATSGPAVIERFRTLVSLIGLRQRRHLTVRDVRSLISHILFRDRTCYEVPLLLAADDPSCVLDIAYFQGTGGRGVPAGSVLERGAALLAEADVARVGNPVDDRRLAGSDGVRRMSFADRSSDYPSELIVEARRRAGTGYESNPVLARSAHEAARRQAYFERADDGWWTMLPYQRLRQFVEALQAPAGANHAALLNEVAVAISMYEGMIDEERARSSLWLATTDTGIGEFRSFRRLPISEFRLRTIEPSTPYVEAMPDRLQLVHVSSGAVLWVDLDLLEVLERLREGFVPSMAEGRGILVNLNLFKHQLLATPSTELLLWTEDELLRIEAVGANPGSIALVKEAS